MNYTHSMPHATPDGIGSTARYLGYIPSWGSNTQTMAFTLSGNRCNRSDWSLLVPYKFGWLAQVNRAQGVFMCSFASIKHIR